MDTANLAPTSDLITILTGLGTQASYIRITLSKMKQSGQITSPKRGYYQLAADDHTYLQALEEKVGEINQTDFPLTLFLTSFEANQATQRQQTTTLLKRLGFGAMGNGTYLAIGDRRSVANTIDASHVHALLTTTLTPAITVTDLNQWWDLAAVKVALRNLEQQLNEIFPSLTISLTDNLALLHQYLQLIDLAGSYYVIDPMLPKKLVGDDWLGYRVLRRLIQLGHNIVAQADPKGPYAAYFDFDLLTRKF